MNTLLHKNWWKYLSVALLLFTIIGGMLLPAPRLPILNETIRNLYFHVPMWFGMILLLLMSLVYSIKYLRGYNLQHDVVASAGVEVALWFGVLGLVTGMVWAKFTWGEYWSNDPKQLASAVGLLMYLAYFILRSAIDDDDKRALVSAVYNVVAFFVFIVLIGILPRLANSLHPGADGNPAFGQYDLDHWMRLVFYPAILGWTLLGVWLASLLVRLRLLALSGRQDD
ncbi:MAG TPA: cytochrome c biogenesis protein CcsA [Chitinophagales bacterium]|nr:cytochrome c biogenesis protein CcsA [Chitinophagales bacterium]HRK26476.1 cytochrome c biogenesis protein CcsA [Chitinophagales bacterium]